MSRSILDEEALTNEILGHQLLDAHQYWLNKRLLFNIIVGFSGFISFVLFVPVTDVFYYFGVIIWGVVANALYSFGYVFESYMITKTKRYQEIKRVRGWLFWSGTTLYVIASIIVPYFSVFLLSV